MAWRFYRRLKILPGVSVNLSRTGVSTTVGARGAHVTVGHGKVRETVGLPGTGISYTHVEGTHQEARSEAQQHEVGEPSRKVRAWRGWLWLALAVAIIGMVAFTAAKSAETKPADQNPYYIEPVAPDLRGTAQRPLVVSVPVDREHALSEKETAWSTIGLAVLTGLLFLANLVLIVDAKKVSARQAEDTQQAIKQETRAADEMHAVAEATKNNAVMMSGMFHKQMRAYISVEFGSALYQDERLRFEALPVLTNNGLTPARNVCFKVVAGILDGSQADITFADIGALQVNDVGIAPRQSFTIRGAIPNRVPDEDVAPIMQGNTRRLFAWGRVTYDDVFGGSWETNFCMSYWFAKDGDNVKVFGNFYPKHNNAT